MTCRPQKGQTSDQPVLHGVSLLHVLFFSSSVMSDSYLDLFRGLKCVPDNSSVPSASFMVNTNIRHR